MYRFTLTCSNHYFLKLRPGDKPSQKTVATLQYKSIIFCYDSQFSSSRKKRDFRIYRGAAQFSFDWAEKKLILKHISLIKKMNFVQENNHVLYIWNGTISGDIEQEVNQLKAIPNVQVNVENADRVLLGENFVLQN